MVSCGFYIMSTYEALSRPFIIVDVIFACIFAVDYILWFIAAQNKLLHIFMPMPVVDILTIVPVFLDLAGDAFVRLDFLRFLRFLRVIRIFRVFKILRVLRMWRVMRMSDSSIKRQIMRMIWIVLCLIFCAAGVLQIIEQEFGDPTLPPNEIAQSFHMAVCT